MYQEISCPHIIFQIIFFTFISESQTQIHYYQQEIIIVDCIKILQSHLQKYIYIDLFHKHKLDIVFAILAYSLTNQEERQYINNDPYLFAQIAEQFTQGTLRTTQLKVQSASLLRLFADRIDEGPRSILQILMIIMLQPLDSRGRDSTQVVQNLKHVFYRYRFYQMSYEQKLETGLLVLAALHDQYKKRSDMYSAIMQFFLLQFDAFIAIQSQIVGLRLIRAISYYPSAFYFIKSRVFILQGIRSFERILKTNHSHQLFKLLSSIFNRIMHVIKIDDPLMQLIVINYYDQLLSKNIELYKIVIIKIRQQFGYNFNKNTHSTMICFNLLYSLLKKQNNHEIFTAIQKQFFQISNFLELPQHNKQYILYEEKLIQIYQIILNKNEIIKYEIQKFTNKTLLRIQQQQKGSLIFKFYNHLLNKINHQQIQSYFYIFWNQIKRRFHKYIQEHNSIHTISYYCFLMSQIIAINPNIHFHQSDLKQLIQITDQIPQEFKQYPILVFLTYLFMIPNQVITFLKSTNSYYYFLNGVTKIKYQGSILKKIFSLAFIALFEKEDDPKYFEPILVQCVQNLKSINEKAQKKYESSTKIKVRTRQFTSSYKIDQLQQQSIYQDQNDNNLINLFHKFRHPLQSINEFQLFKNKFKIHPKFNIDQHLRRDLSLILQTEMVDQTKIRIIAKVKSVNH